MKLSIAAASPAVHDLPLVPRRRCLRAAALALLLPQWAACGGLTDADKVSLEQARADLESGRAVMIDLREPAEHATGVARGARLLPMKQLPARVQEIPTDAAKPVYLICNPQNRSRAVLQSLRERGYAHVRYVEGGMSGWAAKGWPMVPPAR